MLWGCGTEEAQVARAPDVVTPGTDAGGASGLSDAFMTAVQNATDAQRGFSASYRFVQGWAVARDPTTGLYGESTDEPMWSPKNAAADLWPFMVLATYYTDREAFYGDMRTTLESEIRLTSRLGTLPDYFDLTTQDFRYSSADVDRIVFGASEYAKDGLMPVVEAIGRGPYFDRLASLEDGILEYAPFETSRGNLPADSREVNGEMMQVLARLYFATGDERYLDFGQRIASYYLLDDNLGGVLKLLDHGSEIMGGLSEVYIALRESGRDVQQMRAALEQFYDRVLEVCINEYGMIYKEVDLETGEVLRVGPPDTWGYVLDGYYAYGLAENRPDYIDAVHTALESLPHYEDRDWGNADAYADTVESAIVLVNRDPVPEALDFIESQIEIMFGRQRTSGIIAGWWGDGNFARTALMYALMKSQGVYTDAWRADLRFGATREGETLYLAIAADEPWVGRLLFDVPRHERYLNLPLNYPRLNEFPEWFTLEPGRRYAVAPVGWEEQILSAEELELGLAIALEGGALTQYLTVRPL